MIEREHLLDHVTRIGTYFRERLTELARRHACILDVRGMGLMLAVELQNAEQARQAHKAMLARRILINRTQETVLRLLPPYLLNESEVDGTVQAFDEIFTELTAKSAHAQAGGQLG